MNIDDRIEKRLLRMQNEPGLILPEETDIAAK